MRNRGRVWWGVIAIALAVIHGADHFYYGLAVHATGPSFPRGVRGVQLLLGTILLAAIGIAMIWSGIRPSSSAAGEGKQGAQADNSPTPDDQKDIR